MPPAPGAQLGAYRILAALGKGGMGEVYRATDTVLGRDVALKFLPEHLVRDEERLARFRREAKLLAAVNHPHIASIYGLEEGAGEPFLVLELVEGEDLAERLRRGPIPQDEAIGIARQVAAALEEAHRKGIIHRDLKPANVKLDADGRVKVLDFGLATPYASDGSSEDISLSPTRSRNMTEAGLILGTAAYMSPEQARGKPVDKRTDIWAFGVLLFEMLSGRQLFHGETVSDVLAAVLRLEPDWTRLPGDTAGSVRRVLRRCLEKDANRRLHDIADARLELEAPDSESSPPNVSRRNPRAVWGVGGGLLLTGILLLFLRLWSSGSITGGLSRRGDVQALHGRFDIDLPGEQALEEMVQGVSLALSPDGKDLVFVHSPVDRGTPPQLYRRPIDSFEAQPIAGTEWSYSPFFSPDSQWVGYFDSRSQQLKKISLRGGTPVVLAPTAITARGGTWGVDGWIIYAPSWHSGLFRVRADGGSPEELTQLRGDKSHRYPRLLPDGSAVLYTASDYRLESFDDATIEVLSLKSRERHVLVRGGSAALYVPTGHLVFARHGAIEVAPFDSRTLEIKGEPETVLSGVVTSEATGVPQFDVAGGMLAYLPGGPEVFNTRLIWSDRKGVTAPFPLPPGLYTNAHFSPDGRQLLIRREGGNAHLWVYDLARHIMSRLTDEWDSNAETWSPDGRRVLFTRVTAGESAVLSLPTDGSSGPETILDHHNASGIACSPDGKWILFDELSSGSGLDLWLSPLEGDRTPRAFLNTRFNEGGPAFSPDGRYVAYWSDETGRSEVYVRPFPGPGARVQVSTDGGSAPSWGGSGREMYFLAGNVVMSAAFAPGSPPVIGTPVRLFDFKTTSIGVLTGSTPTYTALPDGRQFVAVVGTEARPRTIRVILGWTPGARK